MNGKTFILEIALCLFVFSHYALGYQTFSLLYHPGCFKALGIFDSSTYWINIFLVERLKKVVVRMGGSILQRCIKCLD